MTTDPLDTTTKIAVFLHDASFRQQVQTVLLENNLRVLNATTDQDILDFCKGHGVELVILDVRELSLVRAIRATTGHYETPIIVCLQQNDIERIDEAFEVGATDCILFPLPHRLLIRRIDHYLSHAETVGNFVSITGQISKVYDNAPVMIHSVNRAGIVRYVNKMWLETMGYTAEQVINKPYLSLLDPKIHKDAMRSIDNFWEVGTLRNRASRLIRGDSQIVDVLIDSETVNDPLEGKLSISVLHDVTLKKQLEVTLISADRQKQSLINAMRDVVYVVDHEGTFTDIPSKDSPYAPSYVRLLVGKNLSELMPENRANYLMAQLGHVLKSGETVSIEYDLLVRTKQTWFNSVISPLTDKSVLAVTRDITETKQRESSLHESERLYRNLFELATDSIMLVELESGNILEANNSAAKMLGYAPEELSTMNVKNIEASRIAVTETITLDFETNEQMLFEQLYKRKDGTLVPIESHSRIIRYQNTAAVLHFARDITHRRRILQSEYELRLLAESFRDSADAFNRAVTFDDVLDVLIQYVARVVPSTTANVIWYEAATDTARMIRWRGYDVFGFSDDDIGSVAFKVSETGNLRHMKATRQPINVGDVSELEDWHDIVTSSWVKSYMGAPIFIKDELMGFLSIDSMEVNAFDDEQANHLQTFASQSAIAFENARLIQQMRQQNTILEQNVHERTQALQDLVIELRETQTTLQKERQMLQLIMDNITDMIYVKDTEGNYILVNTATMYALGAKHVEDVRGRKVANFFDMNYANLHQQIDRRVLETGQGVVNMDNVMTYADGTQHRQLLSKYPLRDSENKIIGIVGINRDVTDMRRMEIVIDQEREQLKQVLMSARCLLWTAKVELVGENYVWRPTVVNEDTAQALLPLDTRKMPYAQAWQESIVPEDKERRNYVLQTHLRFNRPNFSQELRCRKGDGSLLWLVEDIQIRPINDKEWQLVGICTDITERKRAEANLQQAYGELEHRIAKRTAELVSSNVVLTQEIAERKRAEDAERKQRVLAEALSQSVAALNKAFDRDSLLEYLLDTLGTIVPHDAASIMLLDDNPDYATVVKHRGYRNIPQNPHHYIKDYPDKMAILETHQPFIIANTLEFEGWSESPEYAWVRSQLSVPIRLDEGVIGFLNLESNVARYFTPEHAEWMMAFADQAALAIRNSRVLDQIREYNALLEQNVESRTAQLRAILDAMRDGLIYHNLAEKTQYFNHALLEITGYSADEWWSYSPITHDILVTQSEQERERLFAKWSKRLELYDYYEDEVLLKRKNGETFPAHITRTMVRDGEGEKVGSLTLMRDISQAKQLEAQKARFIANASHELRTPIANMKTRLFLLRRQPERFDEHIAIAEEVARYMQHLIDDMFDLARFERGTIELKREKMSIKSLIESLMQFQQPEAERKNISLKVVYPPDLNDINIDPYRLMQVMTNLISNAVNYTPEGGAVKVSLERDEAKDKPSLMISVQDTGLGIAPEHIKQLFTPFFRATDDSRGAGLGLAISQEIVHLHGGTIDVESEVGKGSTFIVRIPT